jgi:hypothetical protein
VREDWAAIENSFVCTGASHSPHLRYCYRKACDRPGPARGPDKVGACQKRKILSENLGAKFDEVIKLDFKNQNQSIIIII